MTTSEQGSETYEERAALVDQIARTARERAALTGRSEVGAIWTAIAGLANALNLANCHAEDPCPACQQQAHNRIALQAQVDVALAQYPPWRKP